MIDWPLCLEIWKHRLGDRKQGSVAKRAGVRGNHFSEFLKGLRRPTLDQFAGICRELEVPPDEIAAILGAGGALPRVAEQPSRYKAEPPATVEVSQDGATLTLVVHLKPQRTLPHTRPEEEP